MSFGKLATAVGVAGALAACAAILSGCATLTKGTSQIVVIDTPGVPAARCTIQIQSGPQVVVTPGSVNLSKSSNSLPIQCTKPGYLPGTSIIASGTEAMSAGNVILGGVIGLGVDAASGAMNKYPNIVTVAMVPDPASQPQYSRPAPRVSEAK
jgi:hypothetical protein